MCYSTLQLYGCSRQRPKWVNPQGLAIVSDLSGCMMSCSPNLKKAHPFTCYSIFHLKMQENVIKYSLDKAKNGGNEIQYLPSRSTSRRTNEESCSWLKFWALWELVCWNATQSSASFSGPHAALGLSCHSSLCSPVSVKKFFFCTWIKSNCCSQIISALMCKHCADERVFTQSFWPWVNEETPPSTASHTHSRWWLITTHKKTFFSKIIQCSEEMQNTRWLFWGFPGESSTNTTLLTLASILIISLIWCFLLKKPVGLGH